MKKFATVLLFFGLTLSINAQKFISKSGYVKFYSHTPIEEIEANTGQAASILDASTGSVQVSILIRSFSFKKELMEEHFNENYMESDKFPKASFKGSITNLKEIDFSKDGIYNAKVKGEITIHGVIKPLEIPVTLELKKGVPTAKAKFNVVTEDFDIKIPDLVKDKIAKEIEVTVETTYQGT